MQKSKNAPKIPDGVFVDSRATETLSVRLMPIYRTKIETLARVHETSMTEIVLWAFSLLPHPVAQTNTKSTPTHSSTSILYG